MRQSLKISKLDAAKRQLETTIRLYFSTGDPVSIHTLTAAAYNVLRDINLHRGGEPPLIKEQMLDWIRDGYQDQVRAKINEAENFFKHADRDHESTLDFNPEQSDLMILDACSMYYRLTGEWPPLFKAYQTWFVINHQDMFTFPDDQQRQIAMGKDELLALGREGYFNTMIPVLMRIST